MENYNYKEEAKKYDQQVKEYNSYGHDVLFGMAYEFVKSGETVLDLGIGTGLNSYKFADMGLKVTGIDISEDMLKACQAKEFADKLLQHDFYNKEIPFENNSFNHTVCCGVLHFFDKLDKLFEEVKKVTKKDGLWGFSYSPNSTNEGIEKVMTSWGVPIFKHSEDYINELLAKKNMTLLKEQRILLKGADKKNYDMEFSLVIAKN